MSRIVGIDPGLTGALALHGPHGIADVIDMPVIDGVVDAYTLTTIIAEWGSVDRIVIETQQAMPKQGVASTFKTGANYGRILGVCAALERPVYHVRASEWTRALGVGSDKAVHRRRAQDEWPSMADKFACRKDDGRADACLIALWAATRAIWGYAA